MLAKRCLYQCVSNMGKNVTCIDKELDFLKHIKFAERVNSFLLSKKGCTFNTRRCYLVL